MKETKDLNKWRDVVCSEKDTYINKNSLTNSVIKTYPRFSSKNFIASALGFVFLIYFQLIFH